MSANLNTQRGHATNRRDHQVATLQLPCEEFTLQRRFKRSGFTAFERSMANSLWTANYDCDVVSILIVRGPHGGGHSLTADLLYHLQQQALQAGRTLELRACGALRDFIALVGAAKSEATEFVLLDPGDLAHEMRRHPEAGLSEAIDDLRAPYIDVHDDFGDGRECCAGLHKAPVATVIINGNIESGYRIGLRLALRCLEIGRHRDSLATGYGVDG